MAFLAPLLAGLASWAIPKGLDWVGHKITGTGGRARRRRGFVQPRVSAAALRMAQAARVPSITRGGALAVMNKWPLLERNYRYAQGGNLPYGPLNRRLPSVYANTMRGGALPPMHVVRAHTSHSKYGMPEHVARHLAANPRPHMVRQHMAAGLPFLPFTNVSNLGNGLRRRGGLLSYHPAGGRQRPAQPSLAKTMRGAGLLGGTHYVAPHISYSSLGNPYQVRGHYAAGGRIRPAAGLLSYR